MLPFVCKRTPAAVAEDPTTAVPCTVSVRLGVVVPMPTLPLAFQTPEPAKYALPVVVALVKRVEEAARLEEVAW
jgi:hypothetical protein